MRSALVADANEKRYLVFYERTNFVFRHLRVRSNDVFCTYVRGTMPSLNPGLNGITNDGLKLAERLNAFLFLHNIARCENRL